MDLIAGSKRPGTLRYALYMLSKSNRVRDLGSLIELHRDALLGDLSEQEFSDYMMKKFRFDVSAKTKLPPSAIARNMCIELADVNTIHDQLKPKVEGCGEQMAVA